jgi:hypothetical protein
VQDPKAFAASTQGPGFARYVDMALREDFEQLPASTVSFEVGA